MLKFGFGRGAEPTRPQSLNAAVDIRERYVAPLLCRRGHLTPYRTVSYSSTVPYLELVGPVGPFQGQVEALARRQLVEPRRPFDARERLVERCSPAVALLLLFSFWSAGHRHEFSHISPRGRTG